MSPERKRLKRRNHKRNQRRLARMIAEGYSEEEARARILLDGQTLDAQIKQRQREDAALDRLRRAVEDARFPVQPKEPQSVYAVPTGFETSRRRH